MYYKDIVLIDDDPEDQVIFLEVLEQVSGAVKCTVFTSGIDALQKLISKELVPELIISDLNMPLIDGVKILTTLKSHHELCHIPVVILSTASNETIKKELLELGAHSYIVKPNRVDAFITELECLLKG